MLFIILKKRSRVTRLSEPAWWAVPTLPTSKTSASLFKPCPESREGTSARISLMSIEFLKYQSILRS